MQIGFPEKGVALRWKGTVLERAVDAIMNERQVAKGRFEGLAPCNRFGTWRLLLAEEARKRSGAGFFLSHRLAI